MIYTIELNKIYNMDCLEGMKLIETESVDLILCDLPYGVTDCEWDILIQWKPLWAEYTRIIKERGAIVLTSAQPFTTELIASNRKMFRYCWYWIKNQTTGFQFAKHQPLRCVEEVCVFYKKAPAYYPQGLIKLDTPTRSKGTYTEVYGGLGKDSWSHFTNYPKQTLFINCQREGLHPTQKPVELFEYIIKTYTQEGHTVMDNCMGCGTTAIACMNTKRNYIGFELNEKYCDIANERILKHELQSKKMEIKKK